MLAILWLLLSSPAPRARAAYLPKIRPYHAEHYAIDVRLDVASGDFGGVERARLAITRPTRVIELDSRGLDVASVREAGVRREFKIDKDSETLTIELGRERKIGESVALELRYSGRAGAEPDGLSVARDLRDPKRLPIYYTQFEATSARRFFPCDDQPFDKAPTELSADVDPRYQVLSNGALVENVVRNGRRRVRWRLKEPQSTYLVTFVAGQFDSLKAGVDGVPIRVYAAPGRAEESRFSLEVLEKTLPFFNEYFGVRYPWPSYGMVGIPGFYWGGMENTTLTTMTDSEMSLEDSSAVLARTEIAATTAHELAHQWFGDWVTMRWWDDIWLNEAFASYMETIAGDRIFGNDAALIQSVAESWELYFREERGAHSHPIVSSELPSPDDAFDWTNYVKGRHVLRMLDFYVGDAAFRAGVHDYLMRFGRGNASYADFFASIERAAKTDLKPFVDSWLKQRGYPVLEVKERWNASRGALALDIQQHSVHPEDAVVFDFKLPVAFHRRAAPAYDRTVVLAIHDRRTAAEFPLPAEPEWVSWNPGAPALLSVRRKISPAERERQALDDPDSLARLEALFELAEPWISRDAKKLKPLDKRTVKTLQASLLNDPSPYVRVELLDKLTGAKWRHLPGQLDDAALALAKDPPNLPADPIGRLSTRCSAIVLLGKTGSAPGRELAERLLADPSAGIDLVASAASAEARFSDERSIDRLKRALELQGPRGFAFRKSIRTRFAAIENVRVLPELSAILTGPELNDEIFQSVLGRLQNNETVKHSIEGARWLADWALSDRIGDGIKAQVVGLFDESHEPAVRPQIERIAAESKSERIRKLAQEILDSNFK